MCLLILYFYYYFYIILYSTIAYGGRSHHLLTFIGVSSNSVSSKAQSTHSRLVATWKCNLFQKLNGNSSEISRNRLSQADHDSVLYMIHARSINKTPVHANKF